MKFPMKLKENIISKPSRTKSRIRIRSKKYTEEQADSTIRPEEDQECAGIQQKVRLSADIERNLMVDLKICSAVTGSSIAMIVQEIVRDYVAKMDQIDQTLIHGRSKLNSE